MELIYCDKDIVVAVKPARVLSTDEPGGLPAGEISNHLAIPANTLSSHLGVLTRAGLLRSVRGAQGGYHLTRPANEITVGMILRATEGDLAPAECVKSDVPCGRTNECSTRLVFEKVYSAINNVIDNVTLDELIPQCARSVSGHA